jgi:hypothetical protein
MSQSDSDNVLHQDAHEGVVDERLDGVDAENTAIATPASPGASYVQAEVVALRTAIAAILVALRSSGIIPDA